MKVILAAAVGLLVMVGAPASASQLDADVLDELNFVRTRPQDYAQELREAATSRGRYESSFAYEDPGALDEAVDFLERQPPLPPLRANAGLTAAARAYASAQGPRGQVGHGAGASSLGQRLQRQGVFAGMSAENISYGYNDPRDVVRQLVVDSGVASRGHRANIFSRGYQAAGVGCARHQVYGAMCVIDFAGALVQR